MCAEVVTAAARDAGRRRRAAAPRRRARGRRHRVAALERPGRARRGAAWASSPARRSARTSAATARRCSSATWPTRIARGELDVAIVCGAEALATVGRALRDERELPWEPRRRRRRPDDACSGADRAPGDRRGDRREPDRADRHVPAVRERALGARGHDARRAPRAGSASSGRASRASPPRTRTRGRRRSAPPRRSRRRRPDNRLVTLPYTKLLNSNIQTDQAAALILCSDAVAARARDRPRALGLPARRPGTPTTTGSSASARTCTPHPRSASRRAPRWTRRAPASTTIAHLDVYSCFPSAVQIACRELGIDPFADDAAADGDRRADVRRRAREQLRDPRDRRAGRAPARGPGRAGPGDRRRLVPHQARRRHLRRARAARAVRGRAGSGPGRRDAARARAAPGSPARPRPSPSRSSTRARASRRSARSPRCCPTGAAPIAKTTDPDDLAVMGEAPITGREVHLDGDGGVRSLSRRRNLGPSRVSART